MITRIRMTNFRAFEEAEIEFRPITVLVGPNNSGKSALTSALATLAQTVRSPDPRSALLLSGDYVDLGTYKDVVFGNHRGKKIAFEIDVPSRLRREQPAHADQKRLLDDERQPPTPASKTHFRVKFGYRKQRREIVPETLSIDDDTLGTMLRASYSSDSESLMVDSLGQERDVALASRSGRPRLRTRHWLPLPYAHAVLGGRPEDLPESLHEHMRHVGMAVRYLEDSLYGIEFVGPFREPPSRTYLFTGESPSSVGPTGGKAVELLASDASRKGRDRVAVAGQVSEWMARAGIAAEVNLVVLTDRHFELRIAHPLTGESENIADAGYGCSQVLPVLVAGYSTLKGYGYAPRPRAFLVQQPEIHLHPKAQAELGSFFLELAQSHCWSVIETHSEHLVVRLQSFVADPDVDFGPEDLAVYYVYATDQGQKMAKRMHLNEDGTFAEKWPHGFFPEALDEAKRLDRARRRREEVG